MISIQSVGYKKIYSFLLLYGSGSNVFMELIVSDCIAGERGCEVKQERDSHVVIDTMEPTLAESKHKTSTFFGRCSNRFEIASHASTIHCGEEEKTESCAIIVFQFIGNKRKSHANFALICTSAQFIFSNV